MNKLKITILADNKESWMNDYIPKLIKLIEKKGHTVVFCSEHSEIPKGDIAFFLSCGKIVSSETRNKNTHNLVAHASAVPEGKGWSPITWQVLEGKNEIPLSLFEAVDKVDAGPVYFREIIKLEGYELIDEIREKLAEKISDLVLKFIDAYPSVKGINQTGKESFYRKRTSEDSELNIEKSLKEQFNLLRVADNEHYPAFFNYRGRKYILKISKKD